MVGKLSGKKITIPNVNVPPMPSLVPPGVIHNEGKAENFGEIDASRGYPDVRSFKRKFGLFIPASGDTHDVDRYALSHQAVPGLAVPGPRG